MSYWSFEELFFLSFIAKKVRTACSGTSYKIVPLTNLNKTQWHKWNCIEYKYEELIS